MERKKYLDIAKGILILLVVLHHVDVLFIPWNPVENNNHFFHYFHNYSIVFTTFFMPAFFVITGMCSNFHKSIIEGIVNDAKLFFVPALICEFLLEAIGHNYNIKEYLYEFLLYGAGGWFLASMFLCKTILRLMVRYIDRRKLLVISIIFPFLAFLTYRSNNDYWSYTQALDMFVYLVVGYLLKDINIGKVKTLVSILIYFILLFSLKYFDEGIPVVTQTYNVKELAQVPIHFILYTTGSIGLIGLCRYWKECCVIEYFGKKSLIIYLYHLWFLQMYVPRINEFVVRDFDVYISIVIFVGVYALTLLFCFVIIQIIDNKYMRWSLGKF